MFLCITFRTVLFLFLLYRLISPSNIPLPSCSARLSDKGVLNRQERSPENATFAAQSSRYFHAIEIQVIINWYER